jgi:hypothetical protein
VADAARQPPPPHHGEGGERGHRADDDHAVHQDFFRAHMVTKGKELATACLSIIENLAAVA